MFVFGQMCLKQQCVDVSSISVSDCPDCSGQGVSYFTSLLARLCGYRYTISRAHGPWWRPTLLSARKRAAWVTHSVLGVIASRKFDLITFRVSHRRREMYCARLCVCLPARGRMPTLLHGPGCKLREW